MGGWDSTHLKDNLHSGNLSISVGCESQFNFLVAFRLGPLFASLFIGE